MTEQEQHEEKRLVAQLLLDLKTRKNQINSGDTGNRRMLMEKIKCLCSGLAELYDGKSAHQTRDYYPCAGEECDTIVNNFDHKKLKNLIGDEYYYCDTCERQRTYRMVTNFESD